MPTEGAAAFALAQDSAHRWTVAIIDSTGSTHVYNIDGRSSAEELVAHPPSPPAIGVKVLGSGQVLILRSDHSVTLHNRGGPRAARLEVRGFTPNQILVSSDDKFVVAVDLQADKNLVGGSARRFAIPTTEATFVESGDEMELPPHRPGSLALAADGHAIVVATHKDKPASGFPFAVIKQWDSGSEISLPLEVNRNADFRVHFLDKRRLLVRGNANPPISWIVDIKKEQPPEIFHPIVQNTVVYAAAGDRVALGYESWLFVQETTSQRHRFMGYQALPSTGVAISPNGALIAWSDRDHVWVDHRGDITSEPWQVTLPGRDGWPPQIGFLGEHLLGIATRQGVTVTDMRSKKGVAQAGPVGQNNFSTQWQSSMVMLSASSARGIYEMRDGTLQGPYLFQDGSSPAWLLPATQPGDTALMIFRNKKLLPFTLEELRSSVSNDQLEKREKELRTLEEEDTAVAKLNPLSVDSKGGRYYSEFRSGKTDLTYRSGTTHTTARLGNGLRWVNPSPDGQSFVVADNTGTLQGYSTKNMIRLWSYAPANFAAQCLWSADSHYFACASTTGGYVIDGRTGSAAHQRCTGAFEVRALAPDLTRSAFGQRSICEP